MHSNHQKMDTILGGQLHLESELKKWKTRIFQQARQLQLSYIMTYFHIWSNHPKLVQSLHYIA